jgi:hypothetical protein
MFYCAACPMPLATEKLIEEGLRKELEVKWQDPQYTNTKAENGGSKRVRYL